jgi:hypothetical protein
MKMKKGIIGILMILGLVTAIIAGCGGGSSNNPIGPTPTPTPTPIQWPAATSTYTQDAASAITTTDSVIGQLGHIETKSDGSNLWVKVVFASAGDTSMNFYLLIDDASLTSGYDINRKDATFGTWWGDMGMNFTDADNKQFFDLDFSLVANRADLTNPANLAVVAFNDTGSDIEGSTRNVKGTITATDADPGHLVYEFKIPYTSIGTGAAVDDHIQIVALIGTSTFEGSDPDVTYNHTIPDHNLGIKSAIPGDGTSVTTETNPTPNPVGGDGVITRIKNIKTAVRCTLGNGS